MKFFTKAQLALCFILWPLSPAFSHGAMAPLVVSHSGMTLQANLVVSILTAKLHIPRALIDLQTNEKSCAPIEKAIVQLCITQTGEMQVVKWNRQKWIAEFGNLIQINNVEKIADQQTEMMTEEKKL